MGTLELVFRVIKGNRIYNGNDKDINKKEDIIMRARKIFLVTSIVVFGFLIVYIVSNVMYKKDLGYVESAYPKKYLTEKAYKEIEIKTAKVISNNGGKIKTDLGVIETRDNIEKENVLVFKDVNNKLRLITDINKESFMNIEYVTEDYDIDKGIDITNSAESSRYSKFISDMSRVNKKKYNVKVVSIGLVTFVISGIIDIIVIILMVDRFRHIIEGNFDKRVILDIDESVKVSNRKSKRVEEEFIGEREKDIDEAILGEGGIYTGIEKAKGNTD